MFVLCRLCITFLSFDVMIVLICVAVACLIGIAVCCCLPCILAILYVVADQVNKLFPNFSFLSFSLFWVLSSLFFNCFPDFQNLPTKLSNIIRLEVRFSFCKRGEDEKRDSQQYIPLILPYYKFQISIEVLVQRKHIFSRERKYKKSDKEEKKKIFFLCP